MNATPSSALARPQAHGQAPTDPLYAIAHYFYEQQRYADASDVFQLLVINDPAEPRFAKACGAALQMAGNPAAAIGLYRAAAALAPDDRGAVFHLGECLLATGARQEAAEHLALVADQCREGAEASFGHRAQALLALIPSSIPAEDSANKELS